MMSVAAYIYYISDIMVIIVVEPNYVEIVSNVYYIKY